MILRGITLFISSAACLLGIALASNAAPLDPQSLPPKKLADLLGWVHDPHTTNLCEGYYKESLIHYPHSQKSSLIDISATKTSLSHKGESVLTKPIITEYHKQASAQMGYILPNKKTGKPEAIKLVGDVHIRKPTELIIAKQGILKLKTKFWTMTHVLYRLMLKSKNSTTILEKNTTTNKNRQVYQLTAWGQAKTAKRTSPSTLDLYQATYSTCPPSHCAWHIKASHIQLDSKSGRGTSTNTKLYIRDVPVFWFPYFNFPIDNRRQSGFLNPTYGSSSNSGTDITVPYYFNLAPNYDLTTTPEWLSLRGVKINNTFRYLSPKSRSILSINILPNDAEFQQFKSQMTSKYSGNPGSAKELQNLNDASNTRYSISYLNTWQPNQHWLTQINYSKVSDDYYLEDFNDRLNDQSTNQLLQQGTATYFGPNWTFITNLQGYQTLHPVDQANVPNQYAKLPQLILNGTSSYSPYGLQLSMSNEYVNFQENQNPWDLSDRGPVTGGRLNLQPSISLPLSNAYSFFTPQLQLALTGYNLTRPNPGAEASPGRALPIFDIESGLYFQRNVHLFGKSYTQTLEPHFYYLYVPYRNQDNLPLFDTVDNTSRLTFSYDQLFTWNRFSDIDRIGDANQIALALSTRFRDQNTGETLASASIGELIYFDNRRVGACTKTSNSPYNSTNCEPESSSLSAYNKQRLSPIAGELTYNLSTNWDITGNFAWNPETEDMENQTISFSYQKDYRRLFNISYTYGKGGDVEQDPNSPTESQPSDLRQTSVSFMWPINNRWNLVSLWNYNWAQKRFQQYLYGLEYDSCCWAIRTVISRTFTGLNTNYENQFDTRFYVQFALKGLGDLGTSNPDGLLKENIGNYQDYFGQDY